MGRKFMTIGVDLENGGHASLRAASQLAHNVHS